MQKYAIVAGNAPSLAEIDYSLLPSGQDFANGALDSANQMNFAESTHPLTPSAREGETSCEFSAREGEVFTTNPPPVAIHRICPTIRRICPTIRRIF
ncbi:hypothetical protein [Helicobacter sp. 23-1045]